MEQEDIKMEPGVRGLFVKAKARTSEYNDWILLVSHVAIERRNINEEVEPINMVYCYGCKNISYDYIDKHIDEVNKKPFAFGDASHYRFYKVTEEEKKVIINMFKVKNLKYIKGINKVIDR